MYYLLNIGGKKLVDKVNQKSMQSTLRYNTTDTHSVYQIAWTNRHSFVVPLNTTGTRSNRSYNHVIDPHEFDK